MKHKLHIFSIVLLTAILLVVATFPASAEAQKLPISGDCTGLAFAPDENYPDFIADPNYRFWPKPDWTIMHWRHQLILIYCDYNDDRLDGYQVGSDNWNYLEGVNDHFVALTFGKQYRSDENGNNLDLWEGSYTGSYDLEWNYTSNMILHGRGIYKGLIVKQVMTIPADGWPDIHVEGELIDPGK